MLFTSHKPENNPIMIEAQLCGGPLFVRQTPQERQASLVAFADNQEPRLETVPIKVLLAEIDDYYYHRPAPLPFVESHRWYIRPFWRDHKQSPPLPYNDPQWNAQAKKARKAAGIIDDFIRHR